MIIVSLALLANRRRFRRILEEFSRSFALIVFLGLITLVLGLLVVVSHNVWSADWRVIITLLGWTSCGSESQCLERRLEGDYYPPWVDGFSQGSFPCSLSP